MAQITQEGKDQMNILKELFGIERIPLLINQDPPKREGRTHEVMNLVDIDWGTYMQINNCTTSFLSFLAFIPPLLRTPLH